MNEKQADKLIVLLSELVEVLKPEPLPTLEEMVEARVKTVYSERGINQVFDKAADQYPSVANLINRKTSEVASKTIDAIEKVGDAEYKSQRQLEVEAAVAKALKEKEEMEELEAKS